MPTIDDILNKIGVTNETPDAQFEKQAQDLGLIDPPKSEGENMNLKDFYDNHFDAGIEKTASVRPYGPSGFSKTADRNTRIGSMARDAFDRNLADRLSGGMTKHASTQYNLGSMARDVFDDLLGDRLYRFSIIKTAMEDVGSPLSAASQAANKGDSVVDSGLHGEPEMEVNRPDEADEAIDTAPQYYDLGPSMDAAVEKARIEQALEDGGVEPTLRGTHNVDSGMEEPDSQATA